MNAGMWSDQRDPFRWRSTLLLIGVVSGALAIFGRYEAAGGVLLGLSLYAFNLLLIREIGRSLLSHEEGRIRALVALSTAGRLFLLAIALAAVAWWLGRATVLGACGGLLLAQVNLHVSRTGGRREDR
jgi:hypothetical protein